MTSIQELPDDMSSERISELEADLENSNLNERALCRIVFGPTQIKVCSGSLHRISALFHLASLYDYPPYVVFNIAEQVSNEKFYFKPSFATKKLCYYSRV